VGGFEPRSGAATSGASGTGVTGTASLIGGRPDPGDDISVAWKSFALACESVIHELLDVYMRIVYPL